MDLSNLTPSCRCEGAVSGPMDRDWWHHEGSNPTGGEAGWHCCRSVKMVRVIDPNHFNANITLCFLQVWQPWPSRTLREESGLKKITNTLTASTKSSRAKLIESVLNPSKTSSTEQQNIFITSVKKKRGIVIFSKTEMVRKSDLHRHCIF